jgi:hypothetical protein
MQSAPELARTHVLWPQDSGVVVAAGDKQGMQPALELRRGISRGCSQRRTPELARTRVLWPRDSGVVVAAGN